MEANHPIINNENLIISEIMEKLMKQVVLENENLNEEHFTNDGDNEKSKCVSRHSGNVNSPFDDNLEQHCGSRKARVRHRKHRKTQVRLTGDERRRLNKRHSIRAEANYHGRWAIHGSTFAPRNTTQYLMKEHECENINTENKEDYNISDDFYSSPNDDEYIQKEFTKTYDKYFELHMNDMSKFELVKQLMQLEDKVECLEERCRDRDLYNELFFELQGGEKIQVFEGEIQKLIKENNYLEMTNQMLQSQLSKINAKR